MNFLRNRAVKLAVGIAATALPLAACASENTAAPTDTQSITVYSGRSEEIVAPLFDQFTAETGIEVNARYGDSAELAAQILEEGDNRQADVFFSQDAGALGALSAAGLLQPLEPSVTSRVDAAYRAADDTWVGISGRARVFVHSPDLTDLPTSVIDLMDPKWQGRIGIAPTNASFQAFVTALRVLQGEQVAKDFLAAMKQNAVLYEKNSLIMEAVENGEIELGLVNHYYWYEYAAEIGVDSLDAKIGWFAPGDIGNLVNVAGVGALQRNAAVDTFVDWLLSENAQKFFVNTTFEYALIPGIPPYKELKPMSEIQGPAINLADLADLQRTLDLIGEAGLI